MNIRAFGVVALLFAFVLLSSTSADRPLGIAQGGVVADDTLTIGEIQEMIVGTWIEDSLRDETSGKWVFTEDGTLKQYLGGELEATVNYEVAMECEDPVYGILEARPNDEKKGAMAMLKVVRSGGDVSCKYVSNIKKSGEGPPDPPFLVVSAEGESIHLDQYSSSEQSSPLIK